MTEKEFMSVKEFAESTNVHEVTVRRWLKNGEIRGSQIRHKWLIPITEMERVKTGVIAKKEGKLIDLYLDIWRGDIEETGFRDARHLSVFESYVKKPGEFIEIVKEIQSFLKDSDFEIPGCEEFDFDSDDALLEIQYKVNKVKEKVLKILPNFGIEINYLTEEAIRLAIISKMIDMIDNKFLNDKDFFIHFVTTGILK